MEGGPSQVPFFSEEDCLIELTFENEIDTLRDTITIVSAKPFDNGIWFEDFEDGIPSEGLVYYNTDGGGMTFLYQTMIHYLEVVISRWVVE